MIPLSEARRRVLDGCAVVPPRSVSVRDALGLVLAEEIGATEMIPPFANTAMDGFAVRSADTTGASEDAPVRLRVTGTLAAGAEATDEVGSGEAIRIMTGAPMPPGADAVIMVELTESLDDGTAMLAKAGVPPQNHVRPAGDDVQPGDHLFSPGQVLGPGHLGVLCSLGRTEVMAHPKLRVGVISTGDELVEGPQPLRPGQIRDSNRRTLLSLVELAGAEPIDLGLIRDDETAIREAFENGAATCDAMLSSGGVSMGDFDFVKAVLKEIAEMTWMQIAIRPAKPLAFGTIDGVPMFGLPGNPVSSMVSFELFARPGLRKMMGHRDIDRATVTAIAPDGLPRRPDGKTHFARVVTEYVDGQLRVGALSGQGSHQLTAMALADALAVVPDGDGVPAGGEVELIPTD